METTSNEQDHRSSWVERVQAAQQSDQRHQPWKKALEFEKKARDEGTYDDVQEFMDERKPKPQPKPVPTH